MTNLETLKQQTVDMEVKIKELKAEIDRLENGWEMKCPYKDRDKYYIVNSRGLVKFLFWDNCVSNKKTFNQGHIFPTKQAAELESKRRNLLTRFRAFRDECNGNWKPTWNQSTQYSLYYSSVAKEIRVTGRFNCEEFHLFGYFKNREDTERAIELFGDEIKELFVKEDSK